MKTVNLSKESPSINELLIMARNKSLLLVADDGTTYLLEEADNFDQEAAQLGNFGNSGNVASAEIHNDVRRARPCPGPEITCRARGTARRDG